jgi:hypothetical protein
MWSGSLGLDHDSQLLRWWASKTNLFPFSCSLMVNHACIRPVFTKDGPLFPIRKKYSPRYLSGMGSLTRIPK